MPTHLAPVHEQVLRRVCEREIIWRTDIGPSGGFSRACGTSIPPGSELVALYELRNAGLIAVNTQTGLVFLASGGRTRRAQRPSRSRSA